MRTKTLLLTAAIMAAGVAASMAQSNVYSLNVVGYVNVPVNPGFNMISNPLDDGAGNHLGNVIPSTIDGANVYLLANGNYNTADSFDASAPGWVAGGTLSVPPGIGFWFQVPSVAAGGYATNITFVGTVPQGSATNLIKTGFTLLSAPSSVAQRFGYPTDGQTNTWKYPAADGDTIYFYKNPGGYAAGGGAFYTDDGATFWNGDGVTPVLGPVIPVATGFFSSRIAAGNGSSNWITSFTVQ